MKDPKLELACDAALSAEMHALLDLCERCEALPKGTKATVESRFYSKARAWIPFLVKHYLATTQPTPEPRSN